jgi:hypothetical protein
MSDIKSNYSDGKKKSSAGSVVLDPLSEKQIADELEKQLSLHSGKHSNSNLKEPLMHETSDLMPQGFDSLN